AQARRRPRDAHGHAAAAASRRQPAARPHHRGREREAQHSARQGRRTPHRRMKLRRRPAQRGRRAAAQPGTVNLPVTRASTVTFASMAEMEAVQRRFGADEVVPTYGIVNMPLRAAFEELMVEIEGGHRAATYPTGLSAIAAALFACVKAGDHVLVTDSCYGPTRRLCNRLLS